MKFKKILSLLSLIIMIIAIAGCESNPEDVKLKSSNDIKKYVNKNYGKAKLINTQKEENSITDTLEDNQYQFTYTCNSYASGINIDGSNFGYNENTSCDFDSNYQKYILDKLNLNNIYTTQMYSLSDDYKIIFSVKYDNEDEIVKNKDELVQSIKNIDKRKYFINYRIKVYNDKEYLGSIGIKDSKFINVDDENIKQMTYEFAVAVHNTTNDTNGIKYLYHKKEQYKNIEKLNMEWLYNKNVNEDDWVTLYYFEYEGKIYFIINEQVYINNEDGFKKNYYNGNYTSYWFK